MALTSSGSININAIVGEFGGSAPHALSEYYRNGGEVPANNTNVPTSGEIKLSDFYGAVNEIQQTYNSNATNLNLSSIFGSNWATAVPKRVIINSGVTIGATSGNYAINVPSGMGGTLIIDNNGAIEGYGGAANGGTGGNAIHCTHTSGVTINNASGAHIKSGGGGGGKGGNGGTGGNGGSGGTGGQGRTTQYQGLVNRSGWQSQNDAKCQQTFGSWPNGGFSSNFLAGYGYFGAYYRQHCYKYVLHNGGSGGAGGSSGGAGGTGGNGGVGQGYNQSSGSGVSGAGGSSGGSGSGGASGSNGSGAGGTGGARGTGGTGGTGGNGGSFGNAGSNGASGNQGATGATGNSGANGNYSNGSSGSGGSAGAAGASGQSGGAAGYYIYNRNSITFNNSGSVAGN